MAISSDDLRKFCKKVGYKFIAWTANYDTFIATDLRDNDKFVEFSIDNDYNIKVIKTKDKKEE